MKMKFEKSPDRSVTLLGACLGIGAVLALLAFLFLGLTLWTAVLAALLVVCPVVIGWGLFATRRHPRLPASGKSS
jgi:uncharacterized membrane protein